jgi:hypothetical protein
MYSPNDDDETTTFVLVRGHPDHASPQGSHDLVGARLEEERAAVAARDVGAHVFLAKSLTQLAILEHPRPGRWATVTGCAQGFVKGFFSTARRRARDTQV